MVSQFIILRILGRNDFIKILSKNLKIYMSKCHEISSMTTGHDQTGDENFFENF